MNNETIPVHNQQTATFMYCVLQESALSGEHRTKPFIKAVNELFLLRAQQKDTRKLDFAASQGSYIKMTSNQGKWFRMTHVFCVFELLSIREASCIRLEPGTQEAEQI